MSDLKSNYPRADRPIVSIEHRRQLLNAFRGLHWTAAWAPIGFYAWHTLVFPLEAWQRPIGYEGAKNLVILASIHIIGLAVRRKALLDVADGFGHKNLKLVGFLLTVSLGNLIGFGFLGFYVLQGYLYVKLRQLGIKPKAFGVGPQQLGEDGVL
ncbi:MAG TPA: hypothetical protein VK171_10415 [Fimbriimonas sp.]|nr:hypothetical protein [Fimbriimonas sp.]